MKLYEAAKKEVGHMSCPQDREEELFRLGMLAAAQIVEDGASHNMADITKSQNLADYVRGKAEE